MFNFIENFKKIQLPFFTYMQLYLDMGTTNTRIAIKDKGVVLREPTVLGYNKKTKEYVFFGNEARAIIGKVPEFLSVERPMVSGIISNFDSQVALLDAFFKRGVIPYLGNGPLRPSFEAIACVPFSATEIEEKAVEEVLYKTGVSRVYLVEKPLATAIGCGFNIFAHRPLFIVDLGGGIIEATVISGGGVVLQRSLKNAGEHMNKLIYNYIYLKHGLILGEITCEELKINLLNFSDEEKTQITRGKSLETGLPKSVKIKSSDIKEALLSNFNQIVDTIKEMVELSPPEVIDEIYEQGIILTGGLAQIPGLANFFEAELKIKVVLTDNIESSTIIGLIKIGRRKENLQKLKIQLP